MGVKLAAASGGSIELVPTNTASSFTVTVPAKTGTMAIDGPAFYAYKSVNQTGISNATYTKITFDTVTFDTNSNLASSRFTPTVAGYYQINSSSDMGSAVTYGYTILAKNGTQVIMGSGGSSSAASELISTLSGVIYFNGSTDYIEVYVYVTSTSNVIYTGASFSGALIRGA